MFKDKLKQLRIEQNLTQADVAKAINVSPATIGNYEQGTREPRNNEMWTKLADYFNVSIDELMDKTNNVRYSIKFKDNTYTDENDWTQQARTDIPIIYDEVNITPLVFAKYNEPTPITREQQYKYIEYTSRGGHVLYARRNLLEILDNINSSSIQQISNNLTNIINRTNNGVVYWYKKCWSDIDNLFPKAFDLETLYDLLDKCLCVDKIAAQEFSLVSLDINSDWLREKLH